MAATDYGKVAEFYDALVVGGADVPFFVDLAKRAGGRVVELMAGTGRVSVPIAAAGVDLTCVDSSSAMLAVLSGKLAKLGLVANVVEQDVANLDLADRFALAFIAFHSFEEITADEARERALRRIFAHLVPGGIFVCTLHDPAIRLHDVGPGCERQWQFRDPGADREIRLSLFTTYEKESSLVRGRQRFEDLGSGEIVSEMPLCFRLAAATEFRSLAARCGFEVKALYGSYDRDAYAENESSTMIWMLSRP